MKLKLKAKLMDLDQRCLVMGILNRTRDSFFDHGEFFEMEKFLIRAEQLVQDGADVLDIGGVKAGPGPEVSEAEELERVIPAVEALAERFDVLVSVDTWNARVIDESMAAGAVLANDISGFASAGYLQAVARHGGAVVATHIRLAPRVPDPHPTYQDLRHEASRFLSSRVEMALSAGIAKESIIVDAGFDLGKTSAQSLELLLSTDELATAGYPVLISASNKTFIGEVLQKPIDERRTGSLAACAIGATKGARIFRVHDVAGTRKTVDAISAIALGSPPAWLSASS